MGPSDILPVRRRQQHRAPISGAVSGFVRILQHGLVSELVAKIHAERRVACQVGVVAKLLREPAK